MTSTRDDRQQAVQPKKLRFITNQGAPQPKRRRVTAACLTCRKRKIACSGEQPTCETCIHNKLNCDGYTKQTRGPETDGHLDAAEPKQRKHSSTELQSATTRDASVRSKLESYGSDDQQSFTAPVHQAAAPSDIDDPDNAHERPVPRLRDRMPYFRWLGPTAIMSGYKQMVVKVHRPSAGPHVTRTSGHSPSLSSMLNGDSQNTPSVFSTTPNANESDLRTPLALPFYDTSIVPPSDLVIHLCEIFFVHVGCNFPFLPKDRFLKDLKAKHVDAILVDAVCALAARFSKHPLLVEQSGENGSLPPSEYGHAFAQRAKVALIETYAVPSVMAIQAALLLAYNEFGESRDSGLWMYLGISMRMAQDLGLQKLEGLHFEGRDGPTPKMVKYSRTEQQHHSTPLDGPASRLNNGLSKEDEELKAIERERVDTFWSVFFLDRVVASGVGRRSTLWDGGIELSFPQLGPISLQTECPAPFPALIRIIHLYGRVADLLNAIQEPSDITPDTPRKLAEMEVQVTNFYQGLSPRLHFEAMNFHHYVKAGEGTNFVLLHFWFHTLIVLLHQPTLLKTFEGKMLQLSPNSQQLSMSSAKTIADILSYSQLIDTKASLGNPFTTQPIYIAACAFLKEIAERTATSASQSRAQSRTASRSQTPVPSHGSQPTNPTTPASADVRADLSHDLSHPSESHSPRDRNLERSLARHTLLAKAAKQNYQLCYNALQSLETYWAGTKYILTVLDQKFKGNSDPLLYTAEEGARSLEQPEPEPAFTSPSWRRKVQWAPSVLGRATSFKPRSLYDSTDLSRSSTNENGQAIGWTLTGTLNSPSTSLGLHYPTVTQQPIAPSRPTVSSPGEQAGSPVRMRRAVAAADPTAATHFRIANQEVDDVCVIQDLATGGDGTFESNTAPNVSYQSTAEIHGSVPDAHFSQSQQIGLDYGYGLSPWLYDGSQHLNMAQFGDVFIESQDIDASLLSFDMLPWLDQSQDNMLPLFDPSQMQQLADTTLTSQGQDELRRSPHR